MTRRRLLHPWCQVVSQGRQMYTWWQQPRAGLRVVGSELAGRPGSLLHLLYPAGQPVTQLGPLYPRERKRCCLPVAGVAAVGSLWRAAKL